MVEYGNKGGFGALRAMRSPEYAREARPGHYIQMLILLTCRCVGKATPVAGKKHVQYTAAQVAAIHAGGADP